jgi:hypothetical protein
MDQNDRAEKAGLVVGGAEAKKPRPSKSTRIAYLKRMLKRLEGEETRVQQLVIDR